MKFVVRMLDLLLFSQSTQNSCLSLQVSGSAHDTSHPFQNNVCCVSFGFNIQLRFRKLYDPFLLIFWYKLSKTELKVNKLEITNCSLGK